MTSQNNLEIKGKLYEHPLAELLAEAASASLTGSFRLSHETQIIVVYLNAGKPVFAASNSRRHRFFEMLLQSGRISQNQLAEIPNFTSDVELRQALKSRGLFSESELDEISALQVREILKTALDWRDAGEWTFSPLMRVKEGIEFKVEIQNLLLEYARRLPPDAIVKRFKSFNESFGANPAATTTMIDLLPQEAFILSRFEKSFLKVQEIKSLSGLTDAAAIQTLYALWLGGFLYRQNWHPAFSDKKIFEINSAKLSLKKPEEAAVFLSGPGKTPEAERKAAPQLIFKKPNAGEPTPTPQVAVEPAKEISLEEYLDRAEQSVSYYEFLDVSSDAAVSDIKRSYFAYAKRFHPDRFHQEKDPGLMQRIQNAFTKAAQAYETLKGDETRKAYDYKLSKHLATLKTKEQFAAAGGGGGHAGGSASNGDVKIDQAVMAKESFDQGFNLLMDDDYDQALPYLARAVQLAPDNARYHAFYGKALSIDENQRFKADAEMQTAVRLDSQNPTFRIILAEFYIRFELFRRAEGELQRLLAIHPDHAEALALLEGLPKK